MGFMHMQLINDEFEREFLYQMPKRYPCIAMIASEKGHRNPICFLYRNQIEEWAIIMGLIPHALK